MREIKFRIYDKKFKWMYHSEDAYIRIWAGEVDFDRLFANGDTARTVIFPTKEAEIMQYTGLKDIKGKEIYENDICKYRDGGIGVVFWNEMRAMFGIDPSAFDNTWDKRKMICPSDEWDLCEIVGNIYENPEMKENKNA